MEVKPMKKWMYIPMALFAFFLFSGNGCDCDDLPDLIIINPNPGLMELGFCDGAVGTHCLRVTIKNQGTADASSFTVAVDFGNYGIQTTNVSSLAAGATVVIQCDFMLPSLCFNPDCNFTIIVDYGDSISETNESNNSQQGWCIG